METATENVEIIMSVSAYASFGSSYFFAVADTLGNVFGFDDKLIDKRVERAKMKAAKKVISKAVKAGADGIMNLEFRMYYTSICASATAYRNI